jgi:hypothetical protein
MLGVRHRQFESGSVDIFDTSKTELETKTENQESFKSLEASNTMDTETNESATITPEDIFNMESSNTNAESITMTPSDLSHGNQSSNLTELKPDARLATQDKLSRGIIPNVKIITPLIYKVTVVFDSITVNEDHEGALSGDAEYDLTAYVQGLKVGLTDKSPSTVCVGCDPSPGLYDVSEGETIEFTPDARVTVEIPNTLPLSIFTVGEEVDRCGRGNHRDNEYDQLITILQKPQDTWFDSIKGIQQQINTHGCGQYLSGYVVNDNEVLGL